MALINRLNSLGYSTASNISDEDLRNSVLLITKQKGLDELKNILQIKVNTNITTSADISKLTTKLRPDIGPSAKSIWDSIGDWILPQSTTTGDTSTTTTTSNPVINKTILIVAVAIGVIAMFIAYKMK